MKTEELLKEENYIYKGRILNLRNDTVILPNGKEAYREVVEHRGGVGVVCVDGEDILLVSQFRYPYRKDIIEIPAGKLEADEDPSVCALRELREETGAVCDNLTPLGCIYPSPGYTDEIIWLFLAKKPLNNIATPDEDEFLNLVRMPFRKAYEMVMSGELSDAKTAVAILRAAKLL